MNILESVIAIFAPHNCISCAAEGEPLCGDCWSKLGNPPRNAYKRLYSQLNELWVRSEYTAVPRELVQLLKFQRAKVVADTIARAMAEVIPKGYQTIVVPVPTASSRRRQRGYDQAVLIARSLASQLGLDYSPVLVRVGQQRQVGAKRTDRLSQMTDAFRVRNIDRIKHRPILLVDDVLTTGATLEAAAKALKDKGVSRVDAVVFAGA